MSQPDGIDYWLQKETDSDMGRINGIPIVPGRPYPRRPPAQYRIRPECSSAFAAGRQGGKSGLNLEIFKRMAEGPTIQLWPTQAAILTGLKEMLASRRDWSRP